MQKAKKILHSIDKYLAIGFDVDHCLVRYNLPETFRIIYKSVGQILVNEKGYPKNILEFGKRERCFIMNGLVFDFKTGYFFKLGQNKEILRAYYGFSPVPSQELEKKFGNPPIYEKFDPYKTQTKEYLCTLTFFECYLPALFAHMIESKKKSSNTSDINIQELLQDIGHALTVKYTHYSGDVHHPTKVYGYYFKEAVENIEKITYKQERMKKILMSLRAKGKILFLASNSHFEYINVLMSYTFGPEWKEIFHFIIPNANKPGFFSAKDRVFKEIDETSNTKFGAEVTKLEPHKMYSDGNAFILEENIRRLANDKTGRILFFGDNYSTDALAAETLEDWDSVCIMEELGDVDFGDGYDQSYWGHWQYEDTPKGRVPTFWYDFMSKNVAMCTSLVDSIEMAQFYGE